MNLYPLKDFSLNGFAVTEKLFSTAEVSAIKDELFNICQPDSTFPKIDITDEPKSPGVVRKIRNLADGSDFFSALTQDKRIIEVLKPVLGDDIALHSSIAWMKPPFVGSIKRPHQDAAYWQHIQPCEFAVVWIAVDDSTLSNGCMNFYQNSHSMGIVTHEKQPELHISDAVLSQYGQPIAMPINAGFATIHHGNTIHVTNDNETNAPRRAVSFAYMSSKASINREMIGDAVKFKVVSGEKFGLYI